MGERQNRTPDATLSELVVFRQYVQRACVQAGGQQGLARVIGVRQPSISKLLKDGGVSGSTIDSVASYLGLSRDIVLGRFVEVKTAVSSDPQLARVIEFANRTMGLDAETINRVVDRLVQAKLQIDLLLLLDAFVWEARITQGGGPPGRPIVR